MRKFTLGCFTIVAVAAGVYAGYHLAVDNRFQAVAHRVFKGMCSNSKSKVSGVSEDMVARAAQITRNPEINQEWIAQQWERVGY